MFTGRQVQNEHQKYTKYTKNIMKYSLELDAWKGTFSLQAEDDGKPYKVPPSFKAYATWGQI